MKKITAHPVWIAVCLSALVIADPTEIRSHDGYAASDEWIEIMFEWGHEIRLRDGIPIDINRNDMSALEGILNDLQNVSWHRIADVDEHLLDDLWYRGEMNLGKPLYNLNNIYKLHVPGAADIWLLAENIESLPQVMSAKPLPLPIELPIPPNYQSNQGYLNPASATPVGIDAYHAWTQTGGTGNGVTICDLEYDWNYNHQDISKAYNSQIRSGCTAGLPTAWQDHGTAVAGMLSADHNSWGISGISHGANLLTCCTITGTLPGVWDVPSAITTAMSNLTAGDVILLEQQWDYSSTSAGQYIPIEWWLAYDGAPQGYNAVYAAILTAVGNGIHVVEAAGNGNYNLDSLSWYGDSGAIIVGAGGVYAGGYYPEGDLQRLSFSSYGSRVNLQGWGENVYTTGYGDLYNAEGTDYYYTSVFAGTSSASPVVAGAAACCVGYWTQGLGYSASSLTPSMLRTFLINTGTPQITPPAGHIGPRPDLFSAFGALAAITPTPTPTPTPTSTPTSSPPFAEYGDAPDESTLGSGVWDAYPAIPGMQSTRFPTLWYSTAGAYAHGTCFMSAGIYLSATNTVPSLELDAKDFYDPDGVPNIDPPVMASDQDDWPSGDDGVVFSFSPPGVTITLQGMPGFFSLLGDLNRDGDWNDPGELLIDNHPASIIGGPEFIPIPSGFGSVPGEMWFRAVISSQHLGLYVPSWPVWDGSMPSYANEGEVEDYFIMIPEPVTPTATPTPSPTPTPTQPCINHGDVNNDGILSAGDAQLAFLIVLGLYSPTYVEYCAADCDGSGIVTAGDAQAIFLVVLGMGTCADPIP
jgi:serine protease